MTADKSELLQHLASDILTYSYDALNLMEIYLPQTGIDMPVIGWLMRIRQDRFVQSDQHKVNTIRSIRQQLAQYLRWRAAHPDTMPLVALNGDHAEAEQMIGYLVSVQLLAENDWLEEARHFTYQKTGEQSGQSQLTDPAGIVALIRQVENAVRGGDKKNVIQLLGDLPPWKDYRHT